MTQLYEVYQEVERNLALEHVEGPELLYFKGLKDYQALLSTDEAPAFAQEGEFVMLIDWPTNERLVWHKGADVENVLMKIWEDGYFAEYLKGDPYFEYGKNEKVKALYTALESAKLDPNSDTSDVLYYRSAQDFVDFIDKDALPSVNTMQLYHDMRSGAVTPDFMEKDEFVLVYDFDTQEYLGFNENDTLAEVNAAIQNHHVFGQAFNSLKPPCKAKELEL